MSVLTLVNRVAASIQSATNPTYTGARLENVSSRGGNEAPDRRGQSNYPPIDPQHRNRPRRRDSRMRGWIRGPHGLQGAETGLGAYGHKDERGGWPGRGPSDQIGVSGRKDRDGYQLRRSGSS